MEKVLSNEMTKFLMIMGALTLGLSIVMAKMISKVKKAFSPYRTQTIIYGIIALIFFAAIALAAYPSLIESPVITFIIFQAYFLLLGICHLFFMKQNLKWAGDEKAIYLDLMFTLLLAVVGSTVFLLIYQWISKEGAGLIMGASIFFFIIPYLFYQTYRRAIAIPPKIVKEWFYPMDQEIDEPEDSKLRNLLVISFEFQKHVNDKDITNFRAKAPAEMEFGQLFYYFINDYNERHSNSKVQIANAGGKPYGWVFYKKPGWKTLVTRYIDSEKTVVSNRIRENEVIICARSAQ